ncbi:hypothetical protein NL676_009506 [Syzygium grande]|nr:hypothetical protein NL676_009506 [Syzygium grande]
MTAETTGTIDTAELQFTEAIVERPPSPWTSSPSMGRCFRRVCDRRLPGEAGGADGGSSSRRACWRRQVRWLWRGREAAEVLREGGEVEE